MPTGKDELREDWKQSDVEGWTSVNQLSDLKDYGRSGGQTRKYAEHLTEEGDTVKKSKVKIWDRYRLASEEEEGGGNFAVPKHIQEVVQMVQTLRGNLKAVCPNGHIWDPPFRLSPIHPLPCPECGAIMSKSRYEEAIDQ